MKVESLIFDNTSGWFDLALTPHQPDPAVSTNTKGEWGVPWNLIGGQWAQTARLLREISKKWKTKVVVVSHLSPAYIYVGIGKERERKMVGWEIDVPGQMATKILQGFDEVYNLVTVPLPTGSAPARKLFCQPHTLDEFPFDAKSRLGVGEKGPIMNATWDAIVKSLPPDADMPNQIVLCGKPGAGKTTFAGTLPGGKLFIDMLGGTQRVRKLPNVLVHEPATLQDVYKCLLQVRNTGEWS